MTAASRIWLNKQMKTAIPQPTIPSINEAQIAIIQSKWYREYTDKMVQRCSSLLSSTGAKVEHHLLSGALELPLAAKLLATRKHPPEAIIAFGAIVKGETDHYEMVRDGCAQGLMQVMLEQKIIVISEVLAVTELKQLSERCSDNSSNKGIEAASACAEMIAWKRKIFSSKSES